MDRWAEESAKIIKDPFKKSDFLAFNTLEIYFIEQEADGKVNNCHYWQGADQQGIGKVVIDIQDFVKSVIFVPYFVT